MIIKTIMGHKHIKRGLSREVNKQGERERRGY
jgi:hypothetical protein